jgi:hypothetical protein
MSLDVKKLTRSIEGQLIHAWAEVHAGYPMLARRYKERAESLIALAERRGVQLGLCQDRGECRDVEKAIAILLGEDDGDRTTGAPARPPIPVQKSHRWDVWA